MSVTFLDPKSALVLIDLQKGITAMPTVHPTEEIVARAARLADAFRARELPVVLVTTSFAPDGGDVLSPAQRRARACAGDRSRLRRPAA